MAKSLGFDYISAQNKGEFMSVINQFVTPEITENPMIFEVFTEKVDDADVLRLIRQINGKLGKSNNFLNIGSQLVENNAIEIIKKIIKR